MMNTLPAAGGVLDQPWILMEQFNIIFAEEKEKAEHDEKIGAIREAQEQGKTLPGIQHERSKLGGL